jgi:hypothetical protein
VYVLKKCLDFAHTPNPHSTIREVIGGMEKAIHLSTEQAEEV